MKKLLFCSLVVGFLCWWLLPIPADLIFEFWVVTVIARILLICGWIDRSKYQPSVERAAAIFAVILAFSSQLIPISIEIVYNIAMYLVARLLTSPRFTDAVMRATDPRRRKTAPSSPPTAPQSASSQPTPTSVH